MKKEVLFLAALLAFSLESMAQQTTRENLSPEESTRMFVERIANKLKINQGKLDSMIVIYNQYADDIRKYNASNNPRVITYMIKIRDDKVKVLLRDSVKYEKYLLFLEGIKNRNSQQMNAPPSKGEKPAVGLEGNR
jgi:hypothetical protein